MRKLNFFQMTGIFLALFFCMSNMTLQAQTPGTPGVCPNAVTLIDFEDGDISGWTHMGFGRGERTSIQLMRAADGDPVRFGNYAIRLNADLTAGQTANTLVCLFNPPPDAFLIPASPLHGPYRRIGMWIYMCPEIRGMFWFRMQLARAHDNSAVAVFGREITYLESQNNPRWENWVYWEFEIPSAGANVDLRPFNNVTASHGFIRLVQEDSCNLGRADGSLRRCSSGFMIIDNIRLVTGLEDLTPPTLVDVTGNGENLNGAVFNTRSINLNATFFDTAPEGREVSGMNFDQIRFIVNGIPYGRGDAGFTITETDANSGSASLDLTLANGAHTIVTHIEDRFGHITTRTSHFTIEDDGATVTSLVPAATAYVGNIFDMYINTTISQDIRSMEATLDIVNGTVAATGGVTFAPNVTGTYTFNPENGRLTISLTNDINAPHTETLATIHVQVPEIADPELRVRIDPVTASGVFADNSASTFALFTRIIRDIEQQIDIEVTRRIIGADGQVLVTDLEGNPIAGATVHVLNLAQTDVLETAVTDADGIARGMAFSATAQSVSFYAEKDGKFSHTRIFRTLPALLTAEPTNIMSGTNIDPSTMKTITWMQNPIYAEEGTYMRLARKVDGEEAFEIIEGISRLNHYEAVGSPGITKASKVILTGLEPRTTYIYQVGDGVNWSPTRQFTTTWATDQFFFTAFGDLQASVPEHMSRWLAAAATIEEEIEAGKNHFFQLQVGDIVDTDDNWRFFELYAMLYNQRHTFANLDRIFAFANHEYQGYAGNIKFSSGVPGRPPTTIEFNERLLGTGTYAVEVGNAIILALDWEHKPDGGTFTQTMQEIARWADYVLENTDAVWRFVTLHYPIFAGGPSSPGSREIYQPIFERHGVHIVFCGHGHQHRREQVRNMQVVPFRPGENARTMNPRLEDGVLHWQIGDIRGDRTNANARWFHIEIDGNVMTATVRDHLNNIVPAEGFVWDISTGNEFEVKFNVVNGNGTLIAKVGDEEIESGDEIAEQRMVNFTATPNQGYRIAAWRLNGELIDGRALTFVLRNLRADAHVTVQFEADLPTVTVDFSTVCDDEHGTLVAKVGGNEINSGAEVNVGSEITFTATPNTGQQVKEWRVNGEVVANHTSNVLVRSDISADKVVTVEFEAGTGLCHIIFANLQLHPNPFVNEVTISGAANSTLEILNVLGAVVHTQAINHSVETIQLNQLTSGVYFFRVSKDGQSKTLQVIKR